MSDVMHSGGCHCGKISFQFRDPSEPTVYRCNCSICVEKQIRAIPVPEENFQLLEGKENLTEYCFNTKEGKHYFCKTCGVQSYKLRRIPNTLCAVLHCLDEGTVQKTTEIFVDGQNFEEAMQKFFPKKV